MFLLEIKPSGHMRTDSALGQGMDEKTLRSLTACVAPFHSAIEKTVFSIAVQIKENKVHVF